MMPSPTTLVLSRDGFGDPRIVEVPIASVRTPHIAEERGGDHKPLPEPTVAVYVPADIYPLEWRGGGHGRTLNRGMKMLVEEHVNDPAAFAQVAEAARQFKPTAAQIRNHRRLVARTQKLNAVPAHG